MSQRLRQRDKPLEVLIMFEPHRLQHQFLQAALPALPLSDRLSSMHGCVAMWQGEYYRGARLRDLLPFYRFLTGSSILSTYAEACRVIVHLTCCLPSARCPLCAEASERIHGAYVRTVADLPALGRRVILKLSVRKFVCGTATCPRKIFTERLPDLVQSYARMTNRLSETLQTLGFATCGELGERLAPKLGMQVSGPTLLRRMRTRSCPPPFSVCILGIDDWCGKKGMTYGTLLVDLELRKPIELLDVKRD